MTKRLKKPLILLALTIVSLNSPAQEKDFEEFSKTPKDASVQFPLDYKILRPRLEYPNWDIDYEVYYHFLTPGIRKTQAAISYKQDGVTTHVVPNAATALAQLDTLTLINDAEKLIGTWRMIKFRSMRFNDSVTLATKTYYRLADTLLEDKSNDEAYAVFTDNNFKLYAKEEGKKDFKKMMSAKYKLENNRFMLVYKLVKASGGVSHVGIDEKGFLILNYPKVIENVKPGEYFSYYAVIEQYIFQKVK